MCICVYIYTCVCLCIYVHIYVYILHYCIAYIALYVFFLLDGLIRIQNSDSEGFSFFSKPWFACTQLWASSITFFTKCPSLPDVSHPPLILHRYRLNTVRQTEAFPHINSFFYLLALSRCSLNHLKPQCGQDVKGDPRHRSDWSANWLNPPTSLSPPHHIAELWTCGL